LRSAEGLLRLGMASELLIRPLKASWFSFCLIYLNPPTSRSRGRWSVGRPNTVLRHGYYFIVWDHDRDDARQNP
jgi:hypothetical protein